jgi:hypothetical protein
MKNAVDFDHILAYPIDGQVWQAGKHDLGCSVCGQDGQGRKLCEGAYTFVDSERDTASRCRAAVFGDVVASLCEVMRSGVPSSECASAGIPAIDEPADFFMINELTSVGGRQTLFNFPDKPFVVLDESFYGLLNEGFRVATLFGREPG